ncbi:MAG TPA: hypothetical protein VFD47_02085, partial [Actinomycetota bacterium]|nr:hypothetical protein [Actinomycetota bacterium]
MKINALTRSWALFCAFALITVILQMSGTAVANHENRTLKLSPEKRNQHLESKHDIIATVSATPVDGPITIHIEIDGPGDPGTSGSGSGDEDSANMPDGNTPESPDRSCVVEVGATECQAFYRSPVEGTDHIRGWIDHDETVEADMGEGWDESLEPGDVPEKDNTDVVRTKWFADLPRGANLTCAPDSASRPQTEINTVTCTLQKNGTGFADWLIDAENLAGANARTAMPVSTASRITTISAPPERMEPARPTSPPSLKRKRVPQRCASGSIWTTTPATTGLLSGTELNATIRSRVRAKTKGLTTRRPSQR